MKKHKKKSIEKLRFEIPLFGQTVYVLSNLSHRQLAEECFRTDKGVFETHDGANASVRTFSGGEYQQVLCIYNKTGKARPVLVHESVHIATNTLKRYGVPVSRKNDETLAYLVQAIYTEVCKKLKVKP